MDETNEQEQGGGLFDTVLGKGKEYLNDPQNQEQLMGQAREHFGNVPGMDQLGGLMGQRGQGAGTPAGEASASGEQSGSFGSAGEGESQAFEESPRGYGEAGEEGYTEP